MRGTAIVVVLGCFASPLVAAAEPAVSFGRDIAPLLKEHCSMCHLTGEEPPGALALYPGAAYRSLVGVPSVESTLLRVKPSRPDESYLIRKLEGTQLEAGGTGVKMPLNGEALANVLTPEEIARIRAWIDAGAPNN